MEGALQKWYGGVQVGEKFPSKAEPAYQYSEVLHKSFLFYYQQRSGKLPHQVPLTLPNCMPGETHLKACALFLM